MANRGRSTKPVSDGLTKRADGSFAFAPGNKFGRGNPNIRRLAAYRQMVNKAVTPEQVRTVMRKLVALAKRGDLAAIKEVLDRTVGKATAAPMHGDHAALEFPTMTTTADTVTAANGILRAMSDGRITAEDAARVGTLIELARRTIETHEIAQRLEALERKETRR